MAAVQSPPASSSVPEYKSLQRIHSIPLVNDSLSYAHSTLSANPYTQYAYTTSLSVGNSAYNLSVPVQTRLAPLIVRADDAVLKGLDVVESKFPYPFTVQTDEVIGTLKSTSDHAYNTAYGMAQSADSTLSPVVDRFESVVNKFQPSHKSPTSPSTTPSSKSQIERAYRLSVELRDQIYTLSGEQVRQAQKQSVVIQRATETIYNLNGMLTAAFDTAKEKSASLGKVTSERVQNLSSGILQELEQIQASTQQLPQHFQQSIQPLQSQLAQSLTDLKAVVGQTPSNGPNPTAKAGQVASAVQNQLGPVLEALKTTIGNLLAGSPKSSSGEVVDQVHAEVNGTS